DLAIGRVSRKDVADRLGSRRRRTVVQAVRAASRAASSPATSRRLQSFASVVGSKLAELELDQVDAGELARWEEWLRSRSYARSSIGTAWRTLRAVYRFAALRGWIDRLPWGAWRPSTRPSGKPRPEREAARTVEELVELLRAARAIDVEREDRGLLGDVEPKMASASLLGLRQGELAGMRWPDLDRSACTVTIARQWRGSATKTLRRHVVRALPELFSILESYRSRLRSHGLFGHLGPVFPMRSSMPGRPRAYRGGECLTRGDLRLAVQRAQLPHPFSWSPHSLRDTFASLEAHGHGGDLKAVMQRTRHASIASLVRYLRSRS